MSPSSIARDSAPPKPEPGAGARLKEILRAQLVSRRKTLDTHAKAVSDELIGRRLLDWCAAHAITSLGVYQPIRSEPDLHAAYNALSRRGVHLSLPVVIGQDAALQFRRWQPGDALLKDALGTLVPAPNAPVVQPQALVVPCLGYNAAGMRLGYGGGFYDRTLADTPRPLTVGICYAFGMVEFVGETHDIALDLILTDAV